ncbi:recombinase family protein [Clostridium gasigenes]|uniref:Site-specific DNA recombinase n=1 Tax=Clostridium gasigenes TaxID=94869 RepID=A0A1H0N217_9CLOT|nr:recombinase family protein [Clostridium gasigenes]SDO86671.1 Site-specific DNA recombinase [Clostridium gasigenes]
MIKIAIYSRKSKFTGKGDSIENQVQMCKDYANTHFNDKNLEFDIYEDEGFTGENLNRPKFKMLMSKLKEYDVLICYRLDRISRTVSDFSSTLEILDSHNCDFVSIKEQFDTSTPMGRAMIYIASVFAQLERETIAERVKDNMLELAKNGRWSGGRMPLGYKSEYESYIDAEGNERKVVKLIKSDKELELVNLIYKTYLEQGSLHKTEVWFTQKGIKSNADILLEKTSLKVILQNPVYVKANKEVVDFMKKEQWNVYGEPDGVHSLLSYNKTEAVRVNGKKTKRAKEKSLWIAAISSCEGVIDPEMWLAVQKQFSKNKDTFPHLGKTHNGILTGRLKCKNCGSNMIIQHGTVSVKTGQKLFYYICSMKKRSKGEVCNTKNLRAFDIEESTINELESLAERKLNFLSTLKKKNNYTLSTKNIKSKKLLLEKQLLEKQKQIDNLVNKLSLDDDIADILIVKIKSLKKETASISEDLEKLNNDIKISDTEEFNISFIESVLNRCVNIRDLSKEEQKQIIDVLIIDILYDGSIGEAEMNLIGSDTGKKK